MKDIYQFKPEINNIKDSQEKNSDDVNILTQSINDMSASIHEQTAAINQINEAMSAIESGTERNYEETTKIASISNNVEEMSEEMLANINKNKF